MMLMQNNEMKWNETVQHCIFKIKIAKIQNQFFWNDIIYEQRERKKKEKQRKIYK